ncbi:LOW QUALITY PROTEIN: uncharacterized protein LOC128252710 [Drosophila gunungcola]|uniref:LOW QUALITY PROTEIN: uncharacterized protein LOC128252710 n=1 Tax=Drosophila gunungcola TaxID=103775 RepID=UPI0022E3214C|nr:LOW QUALITY PROTEIN: uncharacterized protein LOC128252710 [Drosophila gunungcola]
MTQSDSPTFDVTQLSSSALCSKGGVQLPPLMLKGQIRPDQVANARFRLVEADRRPLSDQRFNALIKRLVKCFMSEVEITKRLRKVTARRSVPPADLQLIRHLEALRRNYETERSSLVVKLSLDSRFNLYASQARRVAESQPSKSSKSRKGYPLETPSKSDKILPMKSRKHDYDVRSRQRQSGGSGSAPRGLLRRPIVCNHIETPVDLSHRLREKLYRLQETSKAPLESAQIKESSPDTAALSPSSQVSPSSSDVFYDIAEMEDYDLLSLS